MKHFLILFPILFAFGLLNPAIVLTNAKKGISSREKLALFAFNSSLADPLNILQWTTDNPCEWFGIKCNDDGHVISISFLPSVLISGSIPPEIVNLSYLQDFRIGFSSFPGELPAGFYKLKSLEYVDFASCQFQGNLSEDIGNLVNLRVLILTSNSFSSSIPSTIAKLQNLENLQLGDNQFGGEIPPSITELKSLRVLELFNNKLNGSIPEGFSKLKHLSVLSLASNSFTGVIPSQFGSIANLSSLNLNSNNFSGPIPTALANLTFLTIIDFGKNNLTGPIPMELKSLPLTRLTLESNNLEGTLPGELFESLCSSLFFFNADHNKLSGEIPPEISLCTFDFFRLASNNLEGTIPPGLNARYIDLSNNSLNGSLSLNFYDSPSMFSCNLGDNKLSGELPKFNCSSLGILYLNGNSFTGNLSDTIFHCQFLTNANLSFNQLTGPFPPPSELSSFSLSTLSLKGNQLSGPIGPEMQVFGSLTTLVLSNNSFNGILSDQMNNLTKLLTLDLSNNRFEGPFPEFILNNSALNLIDVSGNRFEGPIPEGICPINNFITTLSLANNRFTGSFPSTIQNCNLLSVLSLRNNMLQNEFPSISNLTNLVSLDLSQNSFQGSILESLLNFTNLQLMDLSYNQFDGEILPESIVQMAQSANTLNLQGNSFSGSIPNEIGLFFSLQHLDLSSNALQGPISIDMQQLSEIKYMNLSQNQINGSIVLDTQNLTSLESLDLSGNSLGGGIPSSLGDLNRLTFLNLSSNQLSGEIPSSISSKFNSSSFAGNSLLCGKPLKKKCRSDTIFPYPAVILSVCGFILLVVLFSLLLFFCTRRPEKFDKLVLFRDVGVELDIEDIREATKNFDNSFLIGEGGFGEVYWAMLPKTSAVSKVAIKKMSFQGKQGDNEFFSEVNTLGKIRHRNLVNLIGAYSNEESQDRILIYEFMENGSLERMFEKSLDPSHPLNSWNLRFEIGLGIARGLCYLHHQCRPAIIHRDLKPANILLDDKFQSCIADFGLARQLKPMASHFSTKAFGTVGYMSIEYARKGKATEKTDVFALGIILLQIVVGKKPTDDEFSSISMRQWVEENPLEVSVDSRIQDIESYKESIQVVVKLGLACTSHNPRQRLTSSNVLNVLNEVYNVMPKPQVALHEV